VDRSKDVRAMAGVTGRGVHPIDATASRALRISSFSTCLDRRAVIMSSKRMLEAYGSISPLLIDATTFAAWGPSESLLM